MMIAAGKVVLSILAILGSLLLVVNSVLKGKAAQNTPIVLNTWAFTDATTKAWDVLVTSKSDNAALDSVEQGCSTCEKLQCDLTVGYGGSPDEDGETTLDAFIMDGTKMDTGAVTDLRYINDAISTARMVMTFSHHSSLGGLQATTFAVGMGAKLSNLSTKTSSDMYYAWKNDRCQPNFRKNVDPDPSQSCGPYKPAIKALNTNGVQPAGQEQPSWKSLSASTSDGHAGIDRELMQQSTNGKKRLEESRLQRVSRRSHDTISMVAIDKAGNIAAGSSTNGASHKIPGRMSDSAVAGAGAYADSDVGGCGSTGDGDIHLRFLPCYQVVEYMRWGFTPVKAAESAIKRIVRHYPGYVGALVAVNAAGQHGAAAYGWSFQYAVRDTSMKDVTIYKVEPVGDRHLARAAQLKGD